MKLLCAVAGHRWSETHSGEAVLRCSRCGATRDVIRHGEEPPNYKGIARTTSFDPQSRVDYGGRDD